MGVAAVCVALAVPAAAQEIVHALSGTVVKVDTQAKVLRVKTNDGSDGTFQFPSQTNVELSFDHDVQSQATPIASFSGSPQDQVVVYFYSKGNTRTVVAVQDLGPGPLDNVEGTVTNFDKHQRALTLTNAAGKKQTFHLDPKATADGMDGVLPERKISPEKGDTIRVIAKKGTGPETALFVHQE